MTLRTLAVYMFNITKEIRKNYGTVKKALQIIFPSYTFSVKHVITIAQNFFTRKNFSEKEIRIRLYKKHCFTLSDRSRPNMGLHFIKDFSYTFV